MKNKAEQKYRYCKYCKTFDWIGCNCDKGFDELKIYTEEFVYKTECVLVVDDKANVYATTKDCTHVNEIEYIELTVNEKQMINFEVSRIKHPLAPNCWFVTYDLTDLFSENYTKYEEDYIEIN